jgi:SAM-dependent methyltransferase
MSSILARKFLPYFIYKRLWGKRKQFGPEVNQDDSCWKAWNSIQENAYNQTQRDKLGLFINDAGYKIVDKLSFANKTVLEIGPGDIRHTSFWQDFPQLFILADIRNSMLDRAQSKLEKFDLKTKPLLMKRSEPLPLKNESVDLILSFYSLEHIYPLDPYLKELKRILKPGGIFAGAIPAEGGLAWGIGRFLTSRRWFKKNTNIDLDKLICWEHPNFADKVICDLDNNFRRCRLEYWPFSFFPQLDVNLIVKFVYQKE